MTGGIYFSYYNIAFDVCTWYSITFCFNCSNNLSYDLVTVDRGIFVKSVNPTGPAGLTGRVFVKDRIVAVNDHSLISLSNMEAAGILRNSGQSVRLVLRRRRLANRRFRVTVQERQGDSMTPPHQQYTRMGLMERDIKGVGLDSSYANGVGGAGLSIHPFDDDEITIRRWKDRIPHNKTIKVCHCNIFLWVGGGGVWCS